MGVRFFTFVTNPYVYGVKFLTFGPFGGYNSLRLGVRNWGLDFLEFWGLQILTFWGLYKWGVVSLPSGVVSLRLGVTKSLRSGVVSLRLEVAFLTFGVINPYVRGLHPYV